MHKIPLSIFYPDLAEHSETMYHNRITGFVHTTVTMETKNSSAFLIRYTTDYCLQIFLHTRHTK